MKADYQFEDINTSLPVWKVKCQDVMMREARMPFFKETHYVAAKTGKEAKGKVLCFFTSRKDRFTASKTQDTVKI